MPAIIEIAEIQLRRADNGEALWRVTQETGFDSIQVNREIQILPGSDHFRCASYGFDPQILLPEIPEALPGQPLYIDIWLIVDTELAALAPVRAKCPSEPQTDALNGTSRSEIQRLQSERAALDLQELTDRYRSLHLETLRIEGERTIFAQRVQSLEQAVTTLTSERDALEREVAGIRNQLKEYRDEISAAEAAFRDLAAEHHASGRRVSELSDVLCSEQARNRDLLDSWSWRITVTLRWIGQRRWE